jgi:hypothetical protein
MGYLLRIGHEEGTLNIPGVGKIPSVNEPNKNITVVNNILNEPSGRLGIIAGGRKEWLVNGLLDNNLYFNGGEALREEYSTMGESGVPMAFMYTMDKHQIIIDPNLENDLTLGKIFSPVYNEKMKRFDGGYETIEKARIGLAKKFGAPKKKLPSEAIINEEYRPQRDIFYDRRSKNSKVGAVK